jgi:hypothetical protein
VAVAVGVNVAVAVAVAVGVGVGLGQSSVAMVSSHPPAILPALPTLSSTIQSDQVPFGFVPLNTDSTELVEGVVIGHGDGNVSGRGGFAR